MTGKADLAVKPTLTGQRVVLRPFNPGDLPALRAVLLDPEARVLTGSVHDEASAREPESPDEEEPLLAWYATRNDQADRLDLAVADKATGECVGEAVLNHWDPGNESCNFRIFLGPNGRDRGLGTEATRLIVGYGFERLGLHRIWLEVYSFNPRARRVYEKVGFRTEGVLRESLRYNGQWIDTTIMSILAPEWRQESTPPKPTGPPPVHSPTPLIKPTPGHAPPPASARLPRHRAAPPGVRHAAACARPGVCPLRRSRPRSRSGVRPPRSRSGVRGPAPAPACGRPAPAPAWALSLPRRHAPPPVLPLRAYHSRPATAHDPAMITKDFHFTKVFRQI